MQLTVCFQPPTERSAGHRKALTLHPMASRTTPWHIPSYHVISDLTIPYHSMPYHTILYHTIPYHNVTSHNIRYIKSESLCFLLGYFLLVGPYHTIPYRTIPCHTHKVRLYFLLGYFVLVGPRSCRSCGLLLPRGGVLLQHGPRHVPVSERHHALQGNPAAFPHRQLHGISVVADFRDLTLFPTAKMIPRCF